jgi:hypothetical protein
MDHELTEELVQVGRNDILAGGLEAPLDKGPGACPDHVARLFHRQGG